jgi:hypothetical protein
LGYVETNTIWYFGSIQNWGIDISNKVACW